MNTPSRFITNSGTTEVAATVQGVARRAYELALEYARNRVQGGRPNIDHQVIGLLFLEMFTRLETARTLLSRSAWSLDHGKTDDPKLRLVAKVLAVEGRTSSAPR